MGSKPSPSSWWGGLYQRLRARGIDPATAKIVARHVRDDFKPFAERFLDARSEDVTRERFRELFLGET